MQALRTAARAARPQLRRYATDVVQELEKETAHAAKETSKWRVVTFACIPVCVGLTALTFANAHTHHRNVPAYPYMNYRVKDFPWGPDPLIGTK